MGESHTGQSETLDVHPWQPPASQRAATSSHKGDAARVLSVSGGVRLRGRGVCVNHTVSHQTQERKQTYKGKISFVYMEILAILAYHISLLLPSGTWTFSFSEIFYLNMISWVAWWLSGGAPPSAQGLILETRDRVPRRAPCMEPASPSACVSASLFLMNK